MSSSSSSGSDRGSDDDASHSSDAAASPRQRRSTGDRQQRHQAARQQRQAHRSHRSSRERAAKPSSASLWRTREKQFEAFRASTIVLPVPPTAVRIDKARGYSLQIMSALRWVLPDAIVRSSRHPLARHSESDGSSSSGESSGDDSHELLVTLGVHVSFFHAATKRFFGNTWVSPELALDPFMIQQVRHSSDQTLQCVVEHVVLNFRAYFLSDVVDASCVGVVELVAYEKDPDSKATVSVVGCGWTLLPLFAAPSAGAKDSSVKARTAAPAPAFAIGGGASSGESVNVFCGSPRVLWELPSTQWHAQPKHDACKLYYQLVQYDPLLSIAMVLRKHELVGALDPIPGLKHANLANIDVGANPKVLLLRDDGDTSYADALATFVKLASLVPKSISLAESFTLRVCASTVAVHLRDEVEANLVARLQISRARLHAGAASIHGEISARVLKLALHNGRCYRTRIHTIALKADQPGSDHLRCVSHETKLPGFVLHAHMAIVVQLQFTVHFRITWPPKVKQQAIDAKKPLPPEEDVVLVTIGTRALVPSDGKKLYLYDKQHAATAAASEPLVLASPLQDAAAGYQQRRVLHVELLSGAPCRPYSDHALYTPPQHHGRKALEKQGLALHDSIAFVDLQLAVDGNGAAPLATSPAHGAKAPVSPAKSPQRRTNQSDSDVSDSDDGATHAAAHWAAKMLGKADKNTVLAHTLNALATSEARPPSPLKQTAPSNQDPAPPGSPAKQKSPRRADPVPLVTPHTQTSELSRASKTLLTRHGFLDAHDMSATSHEHASSSPSKAQHHRLDLRSIPQAPKTLDAELRDVYRAHEVRFHFAAYRALGGAAGSPPAASRVPARVYFTFQFYTFAPTRTETLRLSKPFASGSGDSTTHLLMRESPASKPSLAIQFDVDTTATQDPLAPRHFAEYLLYQHLYVDVWDADSLFQLGTCAIPLHELLRQGSGIKKFQAEVDVVEPIDSTSWDTSGDGESSEPYVDVVSYRGRAVVAKVQFLMSNYGLKGRHVLPAAAATAVVTPAPQSLLSRPGAAAQAPVRVKHRVRARPLVDSNAELYRLLAQEGFYGADERSIRHRSHEQPRSTKQRARGLSDATSLSPAEVAILCDLFGATRRVPDTAAAATRQTQSARIKCDLNGKSGLLALLAVTPVQPQQSSAAPVVVAPGPSDPNSATAAAAPAALVAPEVSVKPQQPPPPNALHVDRLARVLALVQANQVGLDRAFALFDANGDGFLAHSEFLEALRSMGTVFAGVSDADVLAIAVAMDTNRDGQVDYREFTTFLTAQTKAKATNQPHAKTATQWRDDVQRILLRALDKGIAVHKIFREFDASGDGSLSYDEFAKALQKLGVPPELAATHCKQLLQSFDANNDGHVSFTEFLASLGIALDDATQAAIVQDTVEDIETIVRETLRRVAGQGVALAQVFAHFDTDKSGKLSVAEFTQALTQLLEPASGSTSANPVRALEQTAIAAFVAKVNANGDSEIDYREFLALCGISGRALEQQTELYSASDRVLAEKKLIKLLVRALQNGLSIEHVFDHFDTNADGRITITEFQRALDKLFHSGGSSSGALGTSNETAEMIAAKFDTDGDREVSLHEFQSFGREIARQQHTLLSLLQPHASKLRDVAATTPALVLGKWQQLCTKELKLARQDMDALKPLLVYFDLVDAAKKVDVTQLCGLLKPAAAPASAHAAPPKDDPMARLRALLQKASAMGLDAAKLFGEFDANGDGEVSVTEFKSLLDKLGCFADVSDADQTAVLAVVDKDGSGKLSMAEFTLLLGESRDQVAPASKTSTTADTTKASTPQESSKASSDVLLKRFTSLLRDAVAQGVDVLKCFAHFDKDSGGQISKREFIDGMQQLGLGPDAHDDATLSAIFSLLDRDGSGEISMGEFKELFEAPSGVPERQEKQQSLPREPTQTGDPAPSVSAPAAPDAVTSPSVGAVEPSAADRLRSLLQLAEQSGHDVSVCFSHFDADGDGKITRAEFAQGMKALPGFEGVSDGELQSLVAALDGDASGSVSLDEFQTFVRATGSNSGSGRSVSAEAPEVPTQSQESPGTVSETATDALEAAEPPQDSKDTPSAAVSTPASTEPSASPSTDASESKSESAGGAELAESSADTSEQPVATEAASELASETKPAPQPRTLGAKKLGAPARSASFATPKGKPPPSFAARRAKTDSATVAAAASDQVPPDAAAPAVAGDSASASAETSSDNPTAAARPGKAPLQRTPSTSFAAARAAKAAAVKAAKAAAASLSTSDAAEPVPSAAVANGLDKLRALLVRAQEQGVGLENSFQHFDSEKTGRLSYDAFAIGLKALGPDFAQLSERDVAEMAAALDRTRAGHIALDDFAQLVKAPSPVEGAVALNASEAPSMASTDPHAPASASVTKSSEAPTTAAAEATAKRAPVSARVPASDRMPGATQAPVRRTSSLRPPVKSSSAASASATAAAASSASTCVTQVPVARTTLLKAGAETPLTASSKSSDTTAAAAPMEASSVPATTPAATPRAASADPVSPSLAPSEPVDLVTNCAYTFHSDPRIRAVELKLRRAAVDAYTRGVLPHRVVAKFLNHDDTGDRPRKRTRDELLRVEFLQVLMELGFSLLSDPVDASTDNLGSGTLDTDGNGARVGPGTARLNDHLYARQLERLARYKHHVRDASKAQKQLVRAVTKTKRATQQAAAEASLQRFADEKSQLLRVLSYYRDGQKKALVYGLVRDHVTTTIALAPHVAALLFLELPFANPYGHYERFRIEVAVPPAAASQRLASDTSTSTNELLDLAIVKSDVEWTYYREHLPLAYGSSSDGEEAKRDRQGNTASAARVEHEMIDDANEVVMDANDRIAIPLRLRWLDTRYRSGPAPPVRASVVIRSCTHGHTVALFKLELEPQPLVCHRVLRFSHPSNAIWRVRLRYPRGKFVVCLDPRVAVDASQSASDHSVGLKCRVGAYPALEEFYVVLYDDEYFARIYEVWHVRIQAKLRLDVHAVLGQRVTSELVIRGDTAQQRQRRERHVQCFSPFGTLPLVTFRPAQVFQLVPNAFNRIELAFCATDVPRRSGSGERVLVHLVDVETHELVGAWVVYVALSLPRITKTYDLTLPVAQPAQKKIAYANSWDEPQTIVLRSSAPAQLTPRDAVLELPSNGTVFLRLSFPAMPPARAVESDVYLLINDRKTEQSEECLLFRLTYA